MRVVRTSDLETGTLFRQCTTSTARNTSLMASLFSSTSGGEADGGRGHNGGVFEWTSTVLEKHDGFIQSRLYPGYVSVIITFSSFQIHTIDTGTLLTSSTDATRSL